MPLIQSTDCKKEWYDFLVIYHLLYDGKPHFLKEYQKSEEKHFVHYFIILPRTKRMF